MAALLGVIYGILPAGFVPLSALMPSMVALNDKGASLATLNLGADGAAFLGSAIVTLFYPLGGGGSVAIAFCVMYLIVAAVSTFLKDASDPGERKAEQSPEPMCRRGNNSQGRNPMLLETERAQLVEFSRRMQATSSPWAHQATSACVPATMWRSPRAALPTRH